MGSEDRSGRSKNLGTYSGFTDGNGSSRHGKHLEILPELCGESGISKHSEVTDMTASSDHFDIKPKVIEGKRSTNPFERCPEVDDGDENSTLLETHPAVSDENHSSKPMVMHPTTTYNESDLVLPTKSLRSSSSCSSSASSLEDLFLVDTGSLRSFVQPASKDNEINVLHSDSSKSKALDKWSPGPTSTFQVSQVTHDLPPTQSPPVQVMDRSGGYDPLRIPSSIFERSKSSTQLEWSAASNESLFSIHIGNNSFSRDQFRSEELTKSGELIVFNPSPPIPEAEADNEGAEFEKSRASVESVKDVTRETRADRSQEKAPAATALQNPSHNSNHSNDSTHSFAFPIVKKKKKKKCACIPFFCCRKKSRRKKCAWPSCYSSNCSCTFCYCSWPSCYFKWLSCYCSNCSWAFCYSWNSRLKRWCRRSSTTLTDRIKSVSVKPDVNEKQPQKPMPTELTSKSSCSCCWFSCFSCRPRCCCCSSC